MSFLYNEETIRFPKHVLSGLSDFETKSYRKDTRNVF